MNRTNPLMILSGYDDTVFSNALKLRELILKNLPGITEQLDLPAKMIAYCYGQQYTDLICVLIPSQKGLKLGFNKGAELPDPDQLLEGTGKISRYVQIKPGDPLNVPAIKNLLSNALNAYDLRKNKSKTRN